MNDLRCTNPTCGYVEPEPPPRDVRSEVKRRQLAKRRSSQSAKVKAMEQADAGADEKWKALADAAIVEAATAKAIITADDVWALLDAKKVPRPPEGRALGPRMARAARAGILEKDTAFVPAERVERHAAPLQTWRSKVFRGP